LYKKSVYFRYSGKHKPVIQHFVKTLNDKTSMMEIER